VLMCYRGMVLGWRWTYVFSPKAAMCCHVLPCAAMCCHVLLWACKGSVCDALQQQGQEIVAAGGSRWQQVAGARDALVLLQAAVGLKVAGEGL
jgi:hypothetical protein